MEEALEEVTVNAGKARPVSRNGRGYLVADATLIREGVLAGSRGPLFYPQDELAKSADRWNDVPVVVNHPTDGGKNVSARSAAVLDRYKVGRVYNAKAGDRLTAELWFDTDALSRVHPTLLARLKRGEQLELSTGLHTRQEPAAAGATHNGRAYTHVARDYLPDHLALLPDTPGACSVRDGCGVFNAEAEKGSTSTGSIRKCPACGYEMTAEEWAKRECAKCGAKLPEAPTANEVVASSRPLGGPVLMNAATKQTIWERLKALLGYDDKAIVDSTVPPPEPAVAVNAGKRPDMDRDKTIDWLVANCDCWRAGKDELAKLTDNTLAGLKAGAEKAEADKQSLVANASKPAAPALTKAQEKAIAFGEREMERKKAEAVARLTANAKGDAERAAAVAVYNALDYEQLEPLVAALPAPAEPALPGRPLYLGAAGAPTTNAPKDDSDNVLPETVWNIDEHASPRLRRESA